MVILSWIVHQRGHTVSSNGRLTRLGIFYIYNVSVVSIYGLGYFFQMIAKKQFGCDFMAGVQMIGKDMFGFEIVFLIDCEQSGWQ